MLSICKHASSTAQFPFFYSRVGKNSWFNVPKHIFYYNGGEKEGYFHIARNKAMKPVFLLFSQKDSLSTLFRMREVQKGSLLVSFNTFDF